MVFATGKTKHNVSIHKRRIDFEKQQRTQKTQSSSGSHQAKHTEIHRITSDGTTKFANIFDRSARGDHSYIAIWDARRRNENDWKLALNIQGPVGPMKARSDYSDTVKNPRTQANKMIKWHQFFPANKFANVLYGEPHGNGIRGLIGFFFNGFERVIHVWEERQCFSKFSLTGFTHFFCERREV